jgi:hypothetical protein
MCTGCPTQNDDASQTCTTYHGQRFHIKALVVSLKLKELWDNQTIISIDLDQIRLARKIVWIQYQILDPSQSLQCCFSRGSLYSDSPVVLAFSIINLHVAHGLGNLKSE